MFIPEFRPYLLLLLFQIFNFIPGNMSIWMPDADLVLVVLAPLVMKHQEAILFGLIAGVLRFLVSYHVAPVNLIMFPALVLLTIFLSRFFIVQSPMFHIVLAALAVFLLMFTQIMYLNMSGTCSADFSAILVNNWRKIIPTIILSPGIFIILQTIYVKK